MGQVLKQDKIGTLSHGSGIISLTSSIITIGGQQYTATLSRTISTDVTMVANTRYQIYAVLSSGVPAMRISANENSVGPSGFVSWKLLGSFYANGLGSVAFGNFLTIEGVPTLSPTDYTPIWSSSGTQPALGNGTILGKYSMAGDLLKGKVILNYGSTSTSGTGGFMFSLPSSLSIDTAKIPQGTLGENQVFGSCRALDAGNSWYGLFSVGSSLDSNATRVSVWTSTGTANEAAITGTAPFTFANGDVIQLEFEVPISGRSNTPIKDL